MQTLINYFFPKSEGPPEETKDIDVVIYVSLPDSIMILRLSDIADIHDKKELYVLAREVAHHQAITFDPEECNNAAIILDAIEKKLSAQ